MRRMGSGSGDAATSRSHARFAAAAAMNALLCEQPAWEVAEVWGRPGTFTQKGAPLMAVTFANCTAALASMQGAARHLATSLSVLNHPWAAAGIARGQLLKLRMLAGFSALRKSTAQVTLKHTSSLSNITRAVAGITCGQLQKLRGQAAFPACATRSAQMTHKHTLP